MSRNPVKLKARIEKKWVLSVGGVDIPMRFVKNNEMAGMALLVSDVANNQLVVDVPDNFSQVMNDLGLGEEFEVTVVKASQSVRTAVQKAYKEAATKVKEADKPAVVSPAEPEQKPEQEMGPMETPEENTDEQ